MNGLSSEGRPSAAEPRAGPPAAAAAAGPSHLIDARNASRLPSMLSPVAVLGWPAGLRSRWRSRSSRMVSEIPLPEGAAQQQHSSPAAPPQEAREAAWQGAEGTWGDADTAEPSFALHCKRAGTDVWVDAFVLTTYGMAIAKWHHHMPPACLAAFVGHVALCALRWAWHTARPASYLRWREAPVALLTASTLASPIPTVVLLDMARGLGSIAARLRARPPPTMLEHPLLFSVGLVFVSRAQKYAILSLGYRLRLWLHLPLHLAMAAWAQAHAGGVCRAVLLPAEPLAGLGGGEQNTTAIQAWYNTFAAFSGLSFLYLVPLPSSLAAASAKHSPLEQCRCVVSMLQLAAGLLLPAAVHVLQESREYVMFHRHRSGTPPPRERTAERLMGRVYEGVWEVARGEGEGGASLGALLFVGMLLGAVWMGISSSI